MNIHLSRRDPLRGSNILQNRAKLTLYFSPVFNIPQAPLSTFVERGACRAYPCKDVRESLQGRELYPVMRGPSPRGAGSPAKRGGEKRPASLSLAE